MLAYLSRYTHRVAIANSRLLAFDAHGVTFRWKDYRARGKTRYKAMTLSADEFIRRFLLHVLPSGFHRIRHYGLLANGGRRELRNAHETPASAASPSPAATPHHPRVLSARGSHDVLLCSDRRVGDVGLTIRAAGAHVEYSR